MYEGSMARSRGRNWWGRKKNGREMGPFDCTWIHWLYYQERKQSMSTDERLVDLVWGRWRGFHHAITVVGLFGTILHLLSPILFFFFKQGKCRTEFHAGSGADCNAISIAWIESDNASSPCISCSCTGISLRPTYLPLEKLVCSSRSNS